MTRQRSSERLPGSGRRPDRRTLMVSLTVAFGVALVAFADEYSRRGHAYTTASAFFWAGLVLIYAPLAGRVLSRDIGRPERVALVILLGVALYAVKVLASPHAFTFTDEYIHLRSTQDILTTHRLFARNPLLPTAGYYPGLPAVTAGLVAMTGLSTFTAGLLIVFVARVVLSVSFFFVAERTTHSSHIAAAASLVYAANPMFLFWGSTFSYENLALPLAAFAVWWVGRTRRASPLPAQGIGILAIAAIDVTHHVVGFALAGLLVAWWLVERVTKRPLPFRSRVGLLGILATIGALAWLHFVARPAASYLFTDNILPALRETGSLLSGRIPRRQLYRSGGYAAPVWQVITGFAAIALLLVALPPALYRSWRLPRRAPTLIAMGVAVAYPFTLLPRLAPGGVAISGRSSEYIFLGLGCVLGVLIVEASRRPARHSGQGRWGATIDRHRTAALAGVVSVVFIGDVTIGTAFYQLLPESSTPRYPSLVQPDAIRAAAWTRVNLGAGRQFAADANDSLALATYGSQNPVSENTAWPIFFAESFDDTVTKSIRDAHLHFLLVDQRMTAGIPPTPGYYFSPQEPGAGKYSELFPAKSLQKFATSTCISVVYSSGNIQIYDVSRIASGSCTP